MSEKKITDEEYREALKDMRDEGFVSPPDIIEAYISQLKKRVDAAVDLLKAAYQSGHREGWEPGPSTDETMKAIQDFICNATGDQSWPASKDQQ